MSPGPGTRNTSHFPNSPTNLLGSSSGGVTQHIKNKNIKRRKHNRDETPEYNNPSTIHGTSAPAPTVTNTIPDCSTDPAYYRIKTLQNNQYDLSIL